VFCGETIVPERLTGPQLSFNFTIRKKLIGGFSMKTLKLLEDAMHQKEQALIQYIRYMREAQDSQDTEAAALFADLAKAEEKHITVIRDQVANFSNKTDKLNKYQETNQYIAQHYDDIVEQ